MWKGGKAMLGPRDGAQGSKVVLEGCEARGNDLGVGAVAGALSRRGGSRIASAEAEETM